MRGVWARERKGNEQKRRAEGASGMGKRKGREEGSEQKGERNVREGGTRGMGERETMARCWAC